ncbi:threonine dehydratase [Undibacterium sp. Jales W-56]|uniref:threonine dehydratase n=1 Tax=Undibacterium sp. Jales W-56 TaxID=2897325 RepID=UPI0021D1D525|nr:threonine dehydratase [Undibacterium sp. Jales W-56]MCU6432833.1 threonine dehydratase [Undibacterium sp. Jales W-56]
MNFSLPNLSELETAAEIVYAALPPTPQYAWPLLCEATAAEVWLKHENHMPTGAFKVRGGLVYMRELLQRAPEVRGVIAATRGNHGQSIAYAVRRYGIPATIVVPRRNSKEKNAAMRALGAELIEYGDEFQESREYAMVLAEERGLHMVPSLHRDLVRGVATSWLELFRAQPALDVVYVPIGQGSGICAAIAARNALGLATRIVGVVSSHALAYKLSFEQRRSLASPVTTLLADGMACRVPDEASLAIIFEYVDAVVAVSDAEVAAAMKLLFITTHNVAEGAGAAALAAVMRDKDKLRGLKVGVPLCGGNVDHEVFAEVLRDSV